MRLFKDKSNYEFNNIVHREIVEQFNGYIERIVWKYFYGSLKYGTMTLHHEAHNSGGVDYYIISNKELSDINFDYSKWFSNHFMGDDDSDNYMIAHMHHDDFLATLMFKDEFNSCLINRIAKVISHITNTSVNEVLKENNINSNQ